jgi:DNA processing protein
VISAEAYKLLVASKLRGIGKRTLLGLAFDKIFYQTTVEELRSTLLEVVEGEAKSANIDAAIRAADDDVERANRAKHLIVSVGDELYPALLRGIPDAPAILFVAGDLRRISCQSIAVIGTRQPTVAGATTAERITRFFAERKWQIVSGLAIGIDTIAHSIALKASTATIAVLAHGLDKLYPKENQQLALDIVESGGLLVTEYAYRTPGFPSNFIERDRIQAALSLGVIMVQSDETGGSWHASRASLKYGRFLIVPRATDSDLRSMEPKARGNDFIIRSSPAKRAEFLKCDERALEKLLILKSREDYVPVEQALLAANPKASVGGSLKSFAN